MNYQGINLTDFTQANNSLGKRKTKAAEFIDAHGSADSVGEILSKIPTVCGFLNSEDQEIKQAAGLALTMLLTKLYVLLFVEKKGSGLINGVIKVLDGINEKLLVENGLSKAIKKIKEIKDTVSLFQQTLNNRKDISQSNFDEQLISSC